MTGKNKFLGAPLVILILAQLFSGVHFIARTAMAPRKLLTVCLLVHGLIRPSTIIAGDRFGRVQVLFL